MNYTTTSTSILQQGWLPIIAKQAIIFGIVLFLVACSTDEEKDTTPPPPGGKGWTHPADLTSTSSISPEGEDAEYPQVAMANNGNAIITWTQHNPDPAINRHEIFKSEYRGGSWTHPTDLTIDNISPAGTVAGGHVNPQVAMNDSNQAVIVWKGVDDSGIYRTFVSDYNMTTTGTWVHPTDLATDSISPDTTNAEYQQVAMDNSGNTIVIWEQSNGANTQIFKSEYRDNGTGVWVWAHPANLGDSPLSPDGDNTNGLGLGAAMDNNGNALVTWAQHDTAGSNRHEIFKGDYNMTTTGDWYPAAFTENINSAIGSALYPQVAMNDSGQAVIVWREQNIGGDFEIYRNDYNMTSPGAWSGAVNILAATTGWDVGDPQVAMDDNGNTIIVWSQHNDSAVNLHEIFKSEYRDNGTGVWVWTPPAGPSDNISPDGTSADKPQVAMGNNGDAIIVWRQQNDTTACGSASCWQIFMSEYRDDGTGVWVWTSPTGSNDHISKGGTHADKPQVTMSDYGNAVIVWEQLDPSGNKQIFMSEYRP